MTPDQLALIKRAHNALDTLFAMLIVATRAPASQSPFFPTRSGEPWAVMTALFDAIQAAEESHADIPLGSDAGIAGVVSHPIPHPDE